MRFQNSVTRIALDGIGIALFVILSMCLRVPVFENYYLCLGYVAMAVWCYSVGTLDGTFVGIAGVIIYCLLINGLRGMPGWALGNIVIGLVIGVVFRRTRQLDNRFIAMIIDLISVVIAVGAGIIVIKSLTEYFLYAQPFIIRVGKNIYGFVSDVVVLLASIPICRILDGQINRIIEQ